MGHPQNLHFELIRKLLINASLFMAMHSAVFIFSDILHMQQRKDAAHQTNEHSALIQRRVKAG